MDFHHSDLIYVLVLEIVPHVLWVVNSKAGFPNIFPSNQVAIYNIMLFNATSVADCKGPRLYRNDWSPDTVRELANILIKDLN